MSTRVLDTNVVSYRMNDHTLAQQYRPHFEGHELAISFMTVAELFEGAFRAGWDAKKRSWLMEELAPYRVIESTPTICKHFGDIRAQRFRQPISVADGWVAATARANGWPLITHNPEDFNNISELRILTEYSKGESHAR